MRIIVTDYGAFWNHENPYLEQFKEAVLVVCLSGKKATDKYECFISPYNYHGLGGSGYGIQTAEYQALESVADRLIQKLNYHETILFLTDNNPESLYPFFAIKSRNEFNTLHLCTFSPWKFESTNIHKIHKFLLNDLSSLQSILYWNSYDVESQFPHRATLSDAISIIRKQYGELLPKIIRGIYSMNNTDKYYFNFASESYIPITEGALSIDVAKKANEVAPTNSPVEPSHATLGYVIKPNYPNAAERTKANVEALNPRVDGKKICNTLRNQRIALANANHIPFESVDCPSIGPCAGTCAKCDEEAAYLTEKIMEIPEEQRIYPQFDPEEVIS